MNRFYGAFWQLLFPDKINLFWAHTWSIRGAAGHWHWALGTGHWAAFYIGDAKPVRFNPKTVHGFIFPPKIVVRRGLEKELVTMNNGLPLQTADWIRHVTFFPSFWKAILKDRANEA
jgi:hypothetical protein